MDVEQTWGRSDVTEGTDEDKDEDKEEDEGRDEEKKEDKDSVAGCIVGQPRATEKRPNPSDAQQQLEHLDPHPVPSIGGEAPPIDRSADSCDGSLTNDVARLLPSRTASPLRKQNGVDSLAPPPICTSPSSFVSVHPPPSAQRSSCKRQNCGHHHHQKVLCSGKNSPSVRTDAVHIQDVAGDDCCVHFVLACLFCELLSMCALLGNCLACGVGGAACCDWAVGCCDWAELAGEAGVSEDACQGGLDCGLLGDCCASSDCLEICLECCSICFPS